MKYSFMSFPVLRHILRGHFVLHRKLQNPHYLQTCYLTGLVCRYDLVAAVCLERKPIITQNHSPLEQKYLHFMQELEFQKSHLSDHELRKIQDVKQAELWKEGKAGDDVDVSKQTAQDFEDLCSKEFESFKPASRITEADLNNDQKSLERKLDRSLVYVVKQKLGNDYRWILPQSVNKEGETLRQTAERCLSEVISSNVLFLGNAPVGFYKYKYPTAVRENGIYGAKVFFFKAQLKQPCSTVESVKDSSIISDYLWLSYEELQQYFQPSYYRSVDAFLLAEKDLEIATA